MVKIVVIGNCQAQFLEGIFLAGGGVAVDKVEPNFTLTQSSREQVEPKLASADFIFIQRTSDDFHLEWLRSRLVADKYAGKTWIWPNIYFDGYYPETRYIYLAGGGKLQSPLEDYHLTPILNAFKAGETSQQAVARLREDPCGNPDPFNASLGNLRNREEGCTILISDYVATEVFKSKSFYTPNHPQTHFLVEMARRLSEAAGLNFDVAKALNWKYRLDKIDIPVFDWIVKKYDLTFPNLSKFKGLSVTAIEGRNVTLGGETLYETEELVEIYYQIYQAAAIL